MTWSMHKIRYIPLVWLTLLLLSSSAWSQSTPESEMPQLYDVEVVLFTHTAADAIQSESWPVDVTVPENPNAIFIQGTALDASGAAESATNTFTPLDEDTLRLVAEARAIARRQSTFEPLLHLSWRQPGLDRGLAPPVYVQSQPKDSRSGQSLQGFITLSLGRYLHIDFDLLLQKPALALQTNDSLLKQPPTSFRIQNHRKMRSGELHYLDHPLIGALVLVSKYESPETEVPLTAEPEVEAEAESTATAAAVESATPTTPEPTTATPAAAE